MWLFPQMGRWTQNLGDHCWHSVSAGSLPPTPPSGLARDHTDMGTTEPRCTLDQRVRVQQPSPAQPGSWPGHWQATPSPLTYFAQLGLWGVPLGCTIPSALGLMYYIYLGLTKPQ